MSEYKKKTFAEINAIIEEQSLTKDQLIDGLRQMIEIRAFENNISKL